MPKRSNDVGPSRHCATVALCGLILAGASLFAACGDTGPPPFASVIAADRTLKIYVEGQNLSPGITHDVGDGSWQGSINNVAFRMSKSELLIAGKPYTGPPFKHLAVTIHTNGTTSTRVVK